MHDEDHNASPALVRGVTFDLDDTLWCGATVLRKASAHFHAFLAARTPALAAAYPPPTFNGVLGRLQREHPQRAHDYTFLRKHALRECVAEVGAAALALHEAEALDAFVDDAFQAFLVPRSEPELFEGVETLLQQLERQLQSHDAVASSATTLAARMGVITNGNCVLSKLPAFFTTRMDFMISAELVGTAKPARAIFDAAVDHFPRTVRRDEIVHVGDHYDADVAGAKAAGLRTIWVNAKWPKPDALRRRDLDPEDARAYAAADAIVTHVCAVADVVRVWNEEARACSGLRATVDDAR